MKNDKLISSLQSFFGVTKNELIFVVIILSGLLIGLVYKYFNNRDDINESQRISEQVYRALDSLAEVSKTTYIGTDMQGHVDSALAAKDTIVKNSFQYPNNPPKEIPKEKINLKTASRVQLMKLPGIGQHNADLIIAFRNKYSLRKTDDIMKIKGIGQKKYEKIKDYIEVK